MFAFYSYLRLRSPDQIKPLTEKLARDADVIYGDQDHMQTAPGPPDTKVRFGLTPVPAIHLTSNAEKEFEKNGNLQIVYIFIAIACLIILIVVINYVNLSNAIALKRAKEVAIRKTIGAFRFRLMLGFILESYAFSATAFISSLVLVLLLLPRFNAFTDNNFDPRILFSMPTLPLLSSLWIAVGFLSGFYPALIFSSFKPVEVLKSGAANPRSGHFSLLFRRGLLVFQFMISAFLIVCTIAVRSQMRFITTMDTGFNRNNVLVVAVKEDIQSKLEALKHEVNKLREVENSTFTSAVPGKRVVFLTVRVPELAGTMNGQDSGMRDMRVMAVDADFIKTMKIQVVEGRDFFRQNVSDPTSSFLLNEAAVKEFNLKNPVGKPFEYRFREVKKGHIIGVVKDFNFASVHNKVDPLVIHILPWYSSLCIRLNTGDPAESISHIQKIWTNFSTSPFDYSFLDTTYDALYKSERTTSKLVTYLSFLALAFACIGLFGVVSFYIQQRTREVGIRKVLGAPGLSLLSELSKEYLLIVISGNVLALYPAWFIVNKWLQNFSYRVSLSMEAFVLAFAISILFAYASILHVIVKMARTNPAVVLKNE
jgi:putative ABC transport system permease protein